MLSRVMTRLLIAMWVSAAAVVHAAENAAPLTVEAAVAQALAANPGLSRFRADAAAAAARPDQAGALPDPTLSAEPGRAAAWQLKLGLTQALPYPGKRELARTAAEYEAQAAGLEAGEATLVLVIQVKQAWWRLFYLDRALETLHRNQEVTRQLIAAAETRYRVGQGLQQDMLRAQLALSRLLEQEIGLEGDRRAAAAQLNALLYQPSTTAIVLPAVVDERLPAVKTEDVLIQSALAARPSLAAQRRQAEAAAAQLDLARKDYRPDFMVGAGYEARDEEKDLVSVMFAMNLPLRTAQRQDRAVDQRSAELLARRYAVQDAEAQLAAEITMVRADYERARRQAELLKTGIIPQASQTVASMLAGYQVGKVDFFNLSDAQIILYDDETRYWQVLSEAQSALARLIAAVGEENIYE